MPLVPIAVLAALGLAGVLALGAPALVPVRSLPTPRGGSVKLVDLTHLGLPHGGARRRQPAAVVVHYSAGTAGGVVADIARQLLQHKASYNYLIDREGTVYLLVDPRNIAQHAGGGALVDGRSPNEATIGVSFVNVGWTPFQRQGWPRLAAPPAEIQRRASKWNGDDPRFLNLTSASWEPFPAAQLQAGMALVAKLHRDFGLAGNALAGNRTVFGHADLAPWKADPGPAFPMDAFQQGVRQQLRQPPTAAPLT